MKNIKPTDSIFDTLNIEEKTRKELTEALISDLRDVFPNADKNTAFLLGFGKGLSLAMAILDDNYVLALPVEKKFRLAAAIDIMESLEKAVKN